MSKSEFAQAYTERMFPDIAAPAGYIDPEFEVLFDNFAFDEVITERVVMCLPRIASWLFLLH